MAEFINKNIFIILIFFVTLFVGFITFLTFIDKSFIRLNDNNLQYLLLANIILLIFFFFFAFLEIKNSIKLATKLIKGHGRILVRKSGTESKIRIMGESENENLLSKCLNIVSKKIK